MKQHFQTTLLGPVISMILTAFVANAEIPKPRLLMSSITIIITQTRFTVTVFYLPLHPGTPLPYPMVAEANIDDTSEKEKIVLIVVDTNSTHLTVNGFKLFSSSQTPT